MYKLEYTIQAKRQIDTLPSHKVRDQIQTALLRLAEHPDLGKRLQGELRDLWSYRTGKYRVVYQVFRSEVRILIIALGDRRDVYERL